MSLTFTLTGKSSDSYFPDVDLSDGDYEFGLTDFEIYYMIPNVNLSNNKFYFDKDDKEIVIVEGLYELHDIDEYLKRAISNNSTRKKTLCKDENDESEYPLYFEARTFISVR